MLLNERLRLLRKEKGITQEHLGNKLGLSKQTISCYENGTRLPDIHTLIKLAEFFGTSIDNLVGHHSSVNPYQTRNNPEIIQESAPPGYKELPYEGKKLVAEYVKLVKLKYRQSAKKRTVPSNDL